MTFDVTKIRPVARRTKIKKEYEDYDKFVEETFRPALQNVDEVMDASKEKVIERNREIEKEFDKSEEKSHKKKHENFVDKYSDSFKSREAYFKKRIETEKWGDLHISEVVNKIYELGAILTDVPLYSYQEKFVKRIFLSVLLNDAEEMTACFSRQSGKSTSVSYAAVTLATFIPQLAEFYPQIEHLKKGIKIGIFAGNNLQVNNLTDIVDEMIGTDRAKDVFSDPDINVRVIKRNWSNGSTIFSQSAAKQTRIESKSFHLIFVDEIQDIDDEKVLKSLHPMLAAHAGSIVKTGTPIPKVCELYRAIMRGKRKDIERPKNRHTVFLVDYKEVQKHNKKYKHYIQQEKERVGEESPYFRMAYGIEWLVEKGMVITPEAFEQRLCRNNKGFEEFHDGLCVAGLDLGKDMHSTVCTVLYLKPVTLMRDGYDDIVLENHVLDWLTISHQDWDQQISVIKNFLKKYKNLKAVGFDATGVGSAVFDLMKNYFKDIGVQPIPYKFNLKLKADMAENFDTLLHSNLIKIPANGNVRRTKKWQNFYIQMTECERVYKQNVTVFQKPADQPNAHDDYVDSLLLALFTAKNKLLSSAKGSQYSVFTSNSKRMHNGKSSTFEEIRKRARFRSRGNMLKSLFKAKK